MNTPDIATLAVIAGALAVIAGSVLTFGLGPALITAGALAVLAGLFVDDGQ